MKSFGTDESGAATVSTTPNRSAYSVSELNLKQNKNDVLSIWKQSGFNVPEAKYSWMYENNPYGAATGWLVRDSNGRAVGSVALFPRGMVINGEHRSAALVGDFVISKEHRTFGPALMLQRAVIESREKHEFDFIYGIPNQQAEAVMQRAGYRLVGPAIRMTRPLRSRYYLRRRIRSSLLANTLAGAVDPILLWMAKDVAPNTKNSFRFEELFDFDQRFDDFSVRVTCPLPIAGHRDVAYLRWRYLRCPHKKYRIHALTDSSSQQILVFLVSHAVGEGVFIAELRAVEQPGVMDYFLSEFLRLQRRQMVDSVSISFFGGKKLAEKLREYGFVMRGTEEKLFVLAGPDVRAADRMFDRHSWCLFEGDTDT